MAQPPPDGGVRYPLPGAGVPYPPPGGQAGAVPYPAATAPPPAGYPLTAPPAAGGYPGSAAPPPAGYPVTAHPAAGGSGYTLPPPAPAAPYGPVCVLGPQYIAPYNVDLILDEKSLSWTGGDYTVKDVNDNPVFKVKGKVMSLHGQRTICDMQGNALVTMRGKIMTAHNRWFVYRGESKEEADLLFTARQAKMFQFKTKLNIFLKGNDKEEACDFRVEGSFSEKSCTIYVGNTNAIIAQMHTKGKVGHVLFGSDRFAVTVYPNVDHAFVTALVVLLDEVNEARSGK